jgi:hypothetical protein
MINNKYLSTHQQHLVFPTEGPISYRRDESVSSSIEADGKHSYALEIFTGKSFAVCDAIVSVPVNMIAHSSLVDNT